jgi:hypothetical protein
MNALLACACLANTLDTADGLLPWLPAKLEYLQAC